MPRGGERFVAAMFGVTVEHLRDIRRRRVEFRLARFYRRRSRLRTLQRNKYPKRHVMPPAKLAGEGELHALLREADLTVEEFCRTACISNRVFHQWYGHPMHRMPVVLLEHLIWARNMAAFLQARGWQPDQFKAQGLPPSPLGRYARTKAQGEAVVAAVAGFTVTCPVHGIQPALGGECPKC